MDIQDKVVNGGKGPQPNTRKNRQLIQDYEAGVPTFVLVSKYGISRQRIDQIREQYGVPARPRSSIKSSKSQGGVKK
jgi:hypothetical protein